MNYAHLLLQPCFLLKISHAIQNVTIEIKEDAIVIKKNITIELQLIDDLIDVARIPTTRYISNLKDVDIILSLNSAIKMLQDTYKVKRWNFKF